VRMGLDLGPKFYSQNALKPSSEDRMAFLVSTLRWALILFLGFLVFVQAILRIAKRLHPVPAPALATRLIDNPIRRRFFQRPEVVAERVRLEPGMVVVEIGPGKGSYTLAMAERVAPDGKVYAIDIQEAVVERLKRTAEREGVTNIYPRGGQTRPASSRARSSGTGSSTS
jgi:hypothetical protein